MAAVLWKTCQLLCENDLTPYHYGFISCPYLHVCILELCVIVYAGSSPSAGPWCRLADCRRGRAATWLHSSWYPDWNCGAELSTQYEHVSHCAWYFSRHMIRIFGAWFTWKWSGKLNIAVWRICRNENIFSKNLGRICGNYRQTLFIIYTHFKSALQLIMETIVTWNCWMWNQVVVAVRDCIFKTLLVYKLTLMMAWNIALVNLDLWR
jgi:hypothetical protein